MFYSPDNEKQKIIHELKQQTTSTIDKKQMMKQAISFAGEQFDEISQKANQFIQSISHLDVYKHLIAEKFEPALDRLLLHAKLFVEHDYSEEELSAMSKKEFHQIVTGQKKRYELLTIIAKKYFKI